MGILDIWLCNYDGAWLELDESSLTAVGPVYYRCPNCERRYQLILAEFATENDKLVELGRLETDDAAGHDR